MVPMTVGGNVTSMRVEGMKSVPAEGMVSKSMTAVVAPMTVTTVAAVTPMATTS